MMEFIQGQSTTTCAQIRGSFSPIDLSDRVIVLSSSLKVSRVIVLFMETLIIYGKNWKVLLEPT